METFISASLAGLQAGYQLLTALRDLVVLAWDMIVQAFVLVIRVMSLFH